MRHHVSSCFIVSSSCAAIVKARSIERLQAMKAKEKFNNRCNMTRKQKQTQIERAEYWTYWDILRWVKSQDETANPEASLGCVAKSQEGVWLLDPWGRPLETLASLENVEHLEYMLYMLYVNDMCFILKRSSGVWWQMTFPEEGEGNEDFEELAWIWVWDNVRSCWQVFLVWRDSIQIELEIIYKHFQTYIFTGHINSISYQ